MEEERRMKGEGEKGVEMTSSPDDDSIPADINSKAGDSNQMKQNDRTASPSSSTKKSVESTSGGNKSKSCSGCLYYSSRLKADSRNPLCVGLTRSLPGASQVAVGQSDVDAYKASGSLIDFRYACVGYSLYQDRREQSSNGHQTRTNLPICIGLEILVDRKVNAADTAPTSAPIHNKEDGNALPQRRSPSPKPSTPTGDEFLTRFTRNANLVANGVAKNIRKVGNQIKQSLDDILYPYRRRPK